ncbi:MAG: hypothetical protein ACRDF4_00865, partial [Rhabdochlamydiaceae bacterium]
DVVVRIQLVPTVNRKETVDILRASAALKLLGVNKHLLEELGQYISIRDKVRSIYPTGAEGGPHTNLDLERTFAETVRETVPDDVVDLFGIIQEPSECIRIIEGLSKAGAKQVNIINLPSRSLSDKRQNLLTISEKVKPSFE